MGVNGGVEFIVLCLHIHNGPLFCINLYVHTRAFRSDDLPDCFLEEKSLLMGDLNARHKDLGSHFTTNINGVRWKAFLDATDTVMLTGDSVPTHTQGGRLDYVALSNVFQCPIETHLLPTLLSDHFALETTLPWSSVPHCIKEEAYYSSCSCPTTHFLCPILVFCHQSHIL